MESPEHLDPLARVANLANLARVANLANLARVANVASRVCLDPLALPARKARRVNLVRLVPPALRANVANLARVANVVSRVSLARRGNRVKMGVMAP